MYSGPSEETFFTFAHTLRAFSDEIEHLLSSKKCTCVLTGKNNNDPIEHRFSLNRNLSGHHLALDVSTFSNNERMSLLRLVSVSCANIDGSHNKLLNKSFFEVVHSMINQYEILVINLWR